MFFRKKKKADISEYLRRGYSKGKIIIRLCGHEYLCRSEDYEKNMLYLDYCFDCIRARSYSKIEQAIDDAWERRTP